MQVAVASPQEMESFAARFAGRLGPNSTLYLQGELGAGKTTFVRGLLRGLGYQGLVKSPTYTLVELYHVARRHICHFDLYRLRTPAELDDIGYRDYLDGHGICLVEWPERAGDNLPTPDLYIHIHLNQTRREVNCAAHTPQGKNCLRRISAEIKGTSLKKTVR